MEVEKRDFASAYALSTDLLRHDLEPLTRAQVFFYTALTGPGHHAKFYLDVAMDNVELAVETDGEDPFTFFWKGRIAKVQARLTPVESAPEDVSRDGTAAPIEAALPFRSASSKKGKGLQLPNLLKPKAPTVAEHFLTRHGSGDVKPGETSTQTTEEARLKDIKAQLTKGSSEHAAGPELVVEGEAGSGSKEESHPASVHEEAEETGGVKMMVDESGSMVIDWATQYQLWVQAAGVADSEEEWEKMNAQTMAQMSAHQRGEALAFD